MDDKYLSYIPRDDIYLFNTGNATKAWLCYGCVYIPELAVHRFIVWAPNEVLYCIELIKVCKYSIFLCSLIVR